MVHVLRAEAVAGTPLLRGRLRLAQRETVKVGGKPHSQEGWGAVDEHCSVIREVPRR